VTDVASAVVEAGEHLAHPLVELVDIQKRYGHVVALRGATLRIYRGAVNALAGDNGAGKSTLIKVLSGVVQPDRGEILFEQRPLTFASPFDSRKVGIEAVYQDLALATDLNAAANIFLGRETLRRGPLGRLFGELDFRAMQEDATRRLAELNIDLGDGRRSVNYLSGGQRQAVAIARALVWSQNVLILDEPTAALGVKGTEQVLDLIRRVRGQGVAVVLIMHNMQQLFEIADRITVLRLGTTVGEFPIRETSVGELVRLMAGLENDEAGN
jgi:simple sugar transport system ATP-binding protein